MSHDSHDEPMDPFAGDPHDPAAALGEQEVEEPLTAEERESLICDLTDLQVFQALLAPKGVDGLIVECEDCDNVHYYSWELLRANLAQLLSEGSGRVHEPAFAPDPERYVSWDYARGYTDGMTEATEQATEPEGGTDGQGRDSAGT